MSASIHDAISKAESALSGVIGARTRLTKLPITEWRRRALSDLERMEAQLDVELARLKYAASHPEQEART